MYNSGYFVELDEMEDQLGTETIVWYDKYMGYFPDWLADVSDKRAVNEYVAYHKGDWVEPTKED